MAVSWTPKLSELVSATKNKCAFCTFVVDRFFHCNRMWTSSKDPERPWFRDDSKESHREKVVECVSKISEGMENDEFLFDVYPSHSNDKRLPDFNKLKIVAKATEHHDPETTKKLFHINHLDLEVFSLESDSVSSELTTRPPRSAPASAESFEVVRSWLHECSETHSRCGKFQTNQLPTRVIDVSDGNNLRLETSQGEDKYAALSYCWGGPQESRTLTSNLDQRTTGFDASDLEQTIQDAIKVTRELGLKYLWTDAQCILQDSEQDKEHEISRMADIYKNAHITICAARAGTVRGGFLKDLSDEETGLSKDLFPMLYRRPSKTATTMREGFDFPPDGFSTLWVREQKGFGFSSEPVMKRAWTLQEHLLSPRFLHYGTKLIWQCNRMQRCDGGLESPGRDLIANSTTSFNRALLFEKKNVSLFNQQQLFNGWYQIVHDYTKRDMSEQTDKLPAIAGVAAEISRLSGTRYMAGLWESNLLHDLMWTSNSKERFTRPEIWRAPTWSWASVNSVVTYEKITPDAIEEAEVLGCQVETYSSESPFAAVKSGKLEICGPLALIPHEDIIQLLQDQSMGPAPPKNNDAIQWNIQLMAHMEFTPILKDHDKKREEELDFEEVYCLVTHSRHWKVLNFGESRVEKTCYFGLILGKNADGNFERLGSFDNEVREWMTNSTDVWERQTITLV